MIKKIEKEGYNLHLIKNNNFKTVLIKLLFWSEIKEDEVTIRNLLFNSLLFSSKNYNSPRKLSIKKADLYGANIVSSTTRMSNYIFNEITMSVLEDNYSEKGLLKESLLFLFDLLNNPDINNGKFNKERFEINKNYLRENINRELENPSTFAIRKYKGLLNSSNPYSVSLTGTIKDLDNINNENLYNYYKDFFKNNNIDIILIGNFDFLEIEDVIDKNCKFKGTKKYNKDLYLNYEKDKTVDIIDTKFNQSILLMGSSTRRFTSFERKYVFLIYNIILGNSPTSKLFQNVREKNSYCYSISSSFNRLDGLFLIYAGISLKNYENTKKEIEKCLKEMKEGDFTDEMVDNAKAFIYTVIEETDDYEGSIIDRYFSTLYFDSDEKEKQIQNIRKVTKDDIINLAKKIEIDTTVLVKENI